MLFHTSSNSKKEKRERNAITLAEPADQNDV